MKSDNVLLLPGWLDSDPAHWQRHWQAAHGYSRVEQHDWARPLRGDWIVRLEDVVLAARPDLPITLVAHSLGCLLVAAWAALSRNTDRVKCAFLASPCDVALESLHSMLTTWVPDGLNSVPEPTQPIQPAKATSQTSPTLATPTTTPMQRSTPWTLPFRSVLLASHTDPYCSFQRAQALAAHWGSSFIDWGDAGHLNAESGLGAWPQGHDLLLALQRGEPASAMCHGVVVR